MTGSIFLLSEGSSAPLDGTVTTERYRALPDRLPSVARTQGRPPRSRRSGRDWRGIRSVLAVALGARGPGCGRTCRDRTAGLGRPRKFGSPAGEPVDEDGG